ncbi:MAG: hypothetical protein OIF57_12675 [Marinobacterium sp.]|nr:hypothetical protein [Marinobacterium sp.]
MYDLSRYDNLFPPSAWLVVLGLCMAVICHLMMLHFEQEITSAIRQARRRSQHADPDYIARPQRIHWQQWRNGRALSSATMILGMVGWAISL